MSHGAPVPSLLSMTEGDIFVAGPSVSTVGPQPRRPSISCGAINAVGSLWTQRATPADNTWQSVCYGNGIFVAIASSGVGNRVMTSPDGVTWTSRTSAADNNWRGVCYGNGLFVAVGTSGSGNRVMTSPDGITWTLRTSAADNSWFAVCFANGLFVACAGSGTGNRVMTSPDGITWTLQTSPGNFTWLAITYGAGLFVMLASASGLASNDVATSPDGITWTLRTATADTTWSGIAYSGSLFVAVSSGGSSMSSVDGITWTAITFPSVGGGATPTRVIYANGIFIAIVGGFAFVSPDGVTWSAREAFVSGVTFNGLAYGNGVVAAVNQTTAGFRVWSSSNEPGGSGLCAYGLADPTLVYTTPANAGSATIPDRSLTYILDPAALIATFTLTMPAAPVNGQIITLVGGSFGITTLTLSANTGQTFATGAAITTLAASGFAKYIYRGVTKVWYRFG